MRLFCPLQSGRVRSCLPFYGIPPTGQLARYLRKHVAGPALWPMIARRGVWLRLKALDGAVATTSATGFTLSGLSNGAMPHFEVTAVNTAGEGQALPAGDRRPRTLSSPVRRPR